MFTVGDYVMKANEGVCRIEDTVSMRSYVPEEGEIPYFLLVPVANENMKIYIPVSEEYKDARPVMCRREAELFLAKIDSIGEEVVENDRQREQAYKDALRSLDPSRLVGILKNMSRRKKERKAEGKKSTAVDDRYFKIAEDALFQELGFALSRDEASVKEMIIERILIE
ncbi:MAG: CarD family transcriptional regulator [Lachnospiraceae bacterium]|nr:CarD family transcriptional regulator [Lachnospiraceae bacterium]